jgi:hypothetical protein
VTYRHEDREAWTLGKADVGKVVKITGAGWTIVGVLNRVDVDPSVIQAARGRFGKANSAYLAVAVWVGVFMGTIPARAVVTVEHEAEDELPVQKKALPGPEKTAERGPEYWRELQDRAPYNNNPRGQNA